ncbi:DASH family cryptochrome [Polaribacter tangerinus]|uniref:DASH family cryptochrome n=1 Tax=Polaribacter tangerinus TaxID=1920034 RepID=UPI000B4B8CD6|nr:DASH family cryptochrome [Polaribacter tangerinus]
MQQQQKKIGLVWFRNNLRVHDNKALATSLQNNHQTIAVYFFDPKLFTSNNFGFKKIERFRAQFLLETVANLKKNLAKKNITLLSYFKSPEDEMHQLCDLLKITSIYTQKEWTSEEVKTNNLIQLTLSKSVSFVEVYDQFLYTPEKVATDFTNIPNVFTAFRKKLEKTVKIDAEINIANQNENNTINNPTEVPNLKILGFKNIEKHPNSAFPFSGGEDAALERLNAYFFTSKKVGFYKKTRNGLLGTDYSTKFSSWLANGSISAKTIYWKIKEYEAKHGANDSTYWVIFELIWRDYFKYISLKYQNKIFKIGGILEKDYHWNNNKIAIESWINGTTKDDFVNANMIELKKTGFMSNRGRQNVASYFAKELLLDWRIGAAYFESLLIDYDVHSNYGNWMYVAGVGNDPRDRKFNTQLQAERYDGNYKYRKRWLQPTLL